MALGIDPSGLHAGVDGAHHIGVGVIAQVQHRRYRHVQTRSGCMKNARIGLGHAKCLGTE